MYVASCPLRVSLFGGSTDTPSFINKYGYGSVISFASNLKTYISLHQDKLGYNIYGGKFIINYSKREEVSNINQIANDPVRVVCQYFKLKPLTISLNSDSYSQGSGLASSSSYIISLIKAISIFKKKDLTAMEICKLAYKLELKINPFCGFQDPYGCGIGGLKRIEFFKDNKIKYEFLETEIFKDFDAYLIFTGVTRNSKNILVDVSKNIDKTKPLLDTLEMAYAYFKNKNYDKFLNLVNLSWEQKKKTSKIISSNDIIRKMDQELCNNKTVVAHKLCGAGNGGFFLVFSKKNKLKLLFNKVKINVDTDGVKGGIL
ncbi:MAG: hypothetical protein JJ845_001720 [Prochlorococcus marinus CUG1436]|nr:hypothetical protein [Prochlorococcus marinus CUG1436]